MFEILESSDSRHATDIAYEASRMLLLHDKRPTPSASEDTVRDALALVSEIERVERRTLSELSEEKVNEYRTSMARMLYSRLEGDEKMGRAGVLKELSNDPMRGFLLNPLAREILVWIITNPGTPRRDVRMRLMTNLFRDQAYGPALTALVNLQFIEERDSRLYPTQDGLEFSKIVATRA